MVNKSPIRKSKKDSKKNMHQNSHKHNLNHKKEMKTAIKKDKAHSNVQKRKVSIKKIESAQIKHYSKKFCPNCGKPVTEGVFCKDCKTVDFDFKDIKILVCNSCGSYNHKNKWQKFSDINEPVRIAVKESVKHPVQYIDLPQETAEELLSYKAGVHKEFTVTLGMGKERYDLPATIDVTLCPKCSKKGTKYFEGVLQVRNSTPEINEFIKNDLAKNRSKGVHINKVVEIDGTGENTDYYYTDKGYLKVIAEKLRDNFGAIIKHNAQLFSINWETSKNLYRLNVLVEFPAYKKGDVLKVGENLLKIISMDEKIHVTNLETNNKTLLAHKESYDILKPVEMMLIKKYPEFEVLDPNTYYQARLMNPSENLQINQKIKVVVDGGEAWMV